MRDKGKRKWDKVIIVILILIIGFCLFKIGKIVYGYLSDRNEYNSIQTEVRAKADEEKVDFDKLLKINGDTVGWIYCEDTVIDYPVVRGDNNSYYLAASIYREPLGCGTIFMDYRNKRDFTDFVSILYGHHMKDGSMFACIEKYKDQDYYEEHPVMEIRTPKKNYKMEIFGGLIVPADSEMYKFDFYSDKEREDYIDKIFAESTFTCDVKVTAEDKLVMLSTCDYDFEDARYLVFGKLVEQ